LHFAAPSHKRAASTDLVIDWPGEKGCQGECAQDDRKGHEMPKMKTKSGVKKRFTMTATGKLKHGFAGKRHRLISHNSKYIRTNRGTSVLSAADTPAVKRWAPYGLK
jgi:large subunit ribosomal protein L35